MSDNFYLVRQIKVALEVELKELESKETYSFFDPTGYSRQIKTETIYTILRDIVNPLLPEHGKA